MSIDTFAKMTLSAQRKGLFRKRPVFRAHASTTPDELIDLERRIGVSIPGQLGDWLLAVGFGDIDDELSFRKEWFVPVKEGQLKGSSIFAQGILGHFYAFDTVGRIYFLCRSEPVFAEMSEDFQAFIAELVRRDYRLGEWTGSLETKAYDG